MSRDLTDDKSTLVQVMAWCHQATSHYLSQCWPSFLSPYGVTRPQWVSILLGHNYKTELISINCCGAVAQRLQHRGKYLSVTLNIRISGGSNMTPTYQALLPGRCSRIIGQVVQQGAEVVRLGPLNRIAGCPCKQGFLTLAKCMYKHRWNFDPICVSPELCDCTSIAYTAIRCF